VGGGLVALPFMWQVLGGLLHLGGNPSTSSEP